MNDALTSTSGPGSIAPVTEMPRFVASIVLSKIAISAVRPLNIPGTTTSMPSATDPAPYGTPLISVLPTSASFGPVSQIPAGCIGTVGAERPPMPVTDVSLHPVAPGYRMTESIIDPG